MIMFGELKNIDFLFHQSTAKYENKLAILKELESYGGIGDCQITRFVYHLAVSKFHCIFLKFSRIQFQGCRNLCSFNYERRHSSHNRSHRWYGFEAKIFVWRSRFKFASFYVLRNKTYDMIHVFIVDNWSPADYQLRTRNAEN